MKEGYTVEKHIKEGYLGGKGRHIGEKQTKEGYTRMGYMGKGYTGKKQGYTKEGYTEKR